MPGLVAQFHTNIDGISDDLNLLAMAQAATMWVVVVPAVRPTVLACLDQFGGGQTHAPLFHGEPLLACQE